MFGQFSSESIELSSISYVDDCAFRLPATTVDGILNLVAMPYPLLLQPLLSTYFAVLSPQRKLQFYLDFEEGHLVQHLKALSTLHAVLTDVSLIFMFLVM